MRAVLVLCAVAAVLALRVPGKGKPTDGPNQITNLPGLNTPINFNQYAGYVNVDKSSNRNLFYWFVESQNDPANDPVVLWLNGGPGCSSLGGFFTENGPFWPNANGGLDINPNAWNNVANVVYLESPAGVGFSYSDNLSDYTTGDKQTADDAYNFLQQFFTMYPQFQGAPFWVSGESYGGHYVPNLANTVRIGNQNPSNVQINLQGHMVGNAWTVAALDNAGAVFYWYTHALNSLETYNGINSNCDFAAIGPLDFEEEGTSSGACNSFLSTSADEMGDIIIYDIYEAVCYNNDSTAATKANQATTLLANLARGGHAGAVMAKSLLDRIESRLDGASTSPSTSDYETPAAPCQGNWLYDYLNMQEVQEAIHANTGLGYAWTDCSPRVNYSYTDLLSSMLPVYDQLIAADLRILVYSGDVDAIVPVTGTRSWLNYFNLTQTEAWRPWLVGQQVGGYTVGYDGLTFATVRDAGHMVPGTQPERAFSLFARFISGKPL